jgi:hypothetical protein
LPYSGNYELPWGGVVTHANLDQLCHISDNLFSS